jgi:hypothetical protein
LRLDRIRWTSARSLVQGSPRRSLSLTSGYSILEMLCLPCLIAFLHRPIEFLEVGGEGLTCVGWKVLVLERRDALQSDRRLHGFPDGILRGEDVLGRQEASRLPVLAQVMRKPRTGLLINVDRQS